MSRSPLAYPLTRGIDGESGGAADLQTDIMRFMAILALCLMAIFALVQSIPLAPESPIAKKIETKIETNSNATPVPRKLAPPLRAQSVEPARAQPVLENVAEVEVIALTRPKWKPSFRPTERTVKEVTSNQAASEPPSDQSTSLPAAHEQNVFTLRFESDLALTQLVAAGQVGFYAIEAGRAQRMAVRNSRISFWEASTPDTFHEMDALTVPRPVIDALARTGANTLAVNWGVTLPGTLRAELDSIMRQHRGGALVINADGKLNLEAS